MGSKLTQLMEGGVLQFAVLDVIQRAIAEASGGKESIDTILPGLW